MTNQADIERKKEYLRQMKGIDESIRCNHLELEELQRLATSVGVTDYSKERVKESHGRTEAFFTVTVEKIEEMETKIKSDSFRLFNLKIEIREKIQDLKNNQERAVLQHKYVCGKSWEEVSEDLYVSIATVHRLHRSALEHLCI
ncbi:MAG: DUF1492 domain-containing protein [Eubacteriales bacterium]